MSNTIKVITELAAEDRKRIDELIGLTALVVATLNGKQVTPDLTVVEPSKVEHPADAPATHLEPPAVVEEKPEVAPVVEEAPAPVSLAEFQKAVTLACAKSPDAKKAVKTVINQYAASVSAIPEDKRAEVMAALSQI